MKTTYIISTLFLSVLIWACDLMGDVDKVKPYYKLEDQTAIRNAQECQNRCYAGYIPNGGPGIFVTSEAISACSPVH